MIKRWVERVYLLSVFRAALADEKLRRRRENLGLTHRPSWLTLHLRKSATKGNHR